MTKITIFKLSKPQGEEYTGVHDVSIKDGVLTFYSQPNSSLPAKKITTSVPFIIEEEVGSF
jgi:hypothetical protein